MTTDTSKLCHAFALFCMNVLLFCLAISPVLSWHESSFYYLFYLGQAVFFAGLLGVFLCVGMWLRPVFLRYLVMLVMEAVGLIYIFMNAKVYTFWRVFINGSLLHLYFSKGGGSQVFEISLAMYIWLITAIVIWIGISILGIIVVDQLKTKVFFKKLAIVLLLIYVSAQSVFIYQIRKDNKRVLQSVITIPYFYETSWVNLLHVLGLSLFPKQSLSAKLQAALAARWTLTYPLKLLHYHVPAHPLNVLFIVVDTLRYDEVNSVDMPSMYQFSKQMSRFKDNMSGGNCTRAGIFSMLYGIPATNWSMALNAENPSIIVHAFQTNHYDMKILASASLLAPPFYHTAFADVPNLQVMTKGYNAASRDAKITEEMIAFLKQESESHHPFFGFVFYDAPHAYNAINIQKPFSPAHALNYFAINNQTNPKPIVNLYRNAVFYDDQLIAKVIKTLKEKQLLKNTIVIFTSDHGQEFNEYHNNYWEHASGFSKYQIRTPLYIAWPGMKQKTYDDQTSHFDFAPTLLKRVLGVSNPIGDYSVGDDFFAKKQPTFMIIGNYAYYAVVANNQVLEFHDSGLYRLYNSQMKPLPYVEINQALMGKVIKQINAYSV